MNLLEELRNLADVLNANDVSYALCGGLAMAAHGFVRATEDIDILVPEPELEHVRRVVAESGFTIMGGHIPLKPGTEHEGMIFRVSKVCGDQLLPLDIMLVTPPYKKVWDSRSVMILEGLRIPVVSRLGMIRMKELGGRRKDQLDLQFLYNERNDGA